jgi:hypothetical protein
MAVFGTSGGEISDSSNTVLVNLLVINYTSDTEHFQMELRCKEPSVATNLWESTENTTLRT